MQITLISHSCLLIRLGGKVVLTDPWMTEPLYWGTLFHRFGVGMRIEELPPLDLIVASHGHDDHLDPGTLRRLDRQTPVAVAPGAARKVRRLGFRDVRPMRPGDTFALGDLTVHACPGRHPGGQVTYVLQGPDGAVFFGGDTAWDPRLLSLGERFPALDVALLPVSGGRLIGDHFPVHLNPGEAARLAAALAPRVAIPIHYHFELRGLPAPFRRQLEVAHTADAFLAEVARSCRHIEAVKLAVGESWRAR